MTRRGLLLFAAMAFVWGIPYLLIRVAVAEISPAVLVFARTAIGTALLLPVALARADMRDVLRHWRWVATFATIEIAIPWVLLGSAETKLSSSLAGLLIAGVPIIGATFALLTGADRVGRRQIVGLVIGFAGVAAIAGGDYQADNGIALAQIVIVDLCYAIAPYILTRRLNGVSSLGIMATALTMVAILYTPIAALNWPATPPSPEALASIAILGAVCTAAAFLLFAALIREIGPVRTSVITYVNPVVAAVLGVLVLSESLTPAMLVGFAIAIAGSGLATRRPEAPEAEAAAVEVAEAEAARP